MFNDYQLVQCQTVEIVDIDQDWKWTYQSKNEVGSEFERTQLRAEIKVVRSEGQGDFVPSNEIRRDLPNL